MSRRQLDAPEPAIRRPDSRDRGSLTVFVAIFAVGLLLLTGLVVDGAAKLRAASRADATAEEAARAATEAALTRGSVVTVDRAAAVRAATAYLAAAGVQGTVTPLGPRSVQVTTAVNGRYLILGVLGDSDFQMTGQATATLTVGVDRGDR